VGRSDRSDRSGRAGADVDQSTLIIFKTAAAILVAASVACHRTSLPVAAFWFDDTTFALPRPVAEKLGGPLTEPEIQSIKKMARTEVERAFADLRVTISDGRQGFWHVVVVQNVPRRTRHPLPSSGESMPLGMFGGSGSVGAVLITLAAIRYAPPDATRQTIVEGIGRGIGRVAAHEFGHQILGPAAAHNDADENCFENGSPDRSSQYYGGLRWTTWGPLLVRKLGRIGRVGQIGLVDGSGRSSWSRTQSTYPTYATTYLTYPTYPTHPT
jgi:hypothetical protein